MKRQARRKRKLFHPDKIATEISQALYRDFAGAQQEYCVNDDTVLYALNRQVNDLLKKYLASDHDKKAVEEVTFKKFLEINSHMGRVNADLTQYFGQLKPGRINQHTLPAEQVFLRARAIIHFVLGPSCDLEDVFERAKHSSGSSLGVKYYDTSTEAKWRLPMTVTERVEPLITSYLAWDESLRLAVENFNGVPSSGWLQTVKGSRSTTVDKTTTKRRLICIEPTGNMYLQQGLMQLFYERLAIVGLNLPDLPDLHKLRARLASITGSDATIDWSEASNCVSSEVPRWFFPSSWYRMVMDLRCDTTSINNEEVELNMISTMGNATTFPIETLVFWALGHAVKLTVDGSRSLFPEWEDLKSVSVFGDDCILPSQYAPLFIDACESIGFIINEEKSFVDPMFKFRESCGGDYLAGYDVRPFYLKAPTSNALSALEPWLYIIGNSFLQKYISYFGELSYVYHSFWSTYFALFRRYRLKLKLVPSYFPDDAGFKGGFDLPRLQRLYDIPWDVVTRSDQGTYHFRFCRFVYRQSAAWDDGIRLATWLKDQGFMPAWRKPIHQAPIRKKGGYVVGKAISAHWTLPA